MKLRHFILLFTSMLVLRVSAEAQTSCAKVLENAHKTYEQGRISEVPDQLEACLKNGFDALQKIEAYKLLANTYLYLNEEERAEGAMLNFLRLNPEYILDAVIDSPEFINLYNAFRTRPIYLIGGKAGGNITSPHVTKTFGVDDPDFSAQQYKSKLGYQVGVTAEIPFSKQFSLNPELYVSGKYYEYTNTLMDFSTITFKENQTWIELPVMLKYNHNKNINRIPFIQAGASVNYLIGSKVDLSRKDKVGEGNIRSFDDNSQDISSLRHSLNYSAVLGGGIKLKNVLGKGYLLIEARYIHGLRNIVNPDKRGSNNGNIDLVYKYLHLDNNFTQNSFVISVGYIIPQYKPKLLQSVSDL